MKESLSKKEILFLTELADLLSRYDAMLHCEETGEMEVLVFEGTYYDTVIPIQFSDCLDETDLKRRKVRVFSSTTPNPSLKRRGI